MSQNGVFVAMQLLNERELGPGGRHYCWYQTREECSHRHHSFTASQTEMF